MNITLNQIMLAVFLTANLYVGLRASRGIKTMDEYALANKSLGLGPLISTLFATLLMSSTIGIETGSYEGIISLIFPLPLAIAAFLLGWLVFPKITRFKKEYTIAGIMHTMYGSSARIMTVLVSTILSILIVIGQLKAFGDIADSFGLSKTKFTLLLGLIVTTYTALGGVRSVAATDVLQLSLIITSFIGFFLLAVMSQGGLKAILGNLPENHNYLKGWSHPKFFKRIPVFFAWSVFPTLIISPPIIQRMLMTPKKRDIRAMFTSFSILYPLLRVLTVILGIGLFVLNGNKHKSMPIGDIISELCHRYPLGQAFFVLGVCAIFMSTMDSFLNSIAIMWSKDVISPMLEKHKKRFDIIKWTKIIAFLIGVVSTFSSIFLDFTLYEIEGYACMLLSSISVPFTMGLIGLRGNKKTFLAVTTIFLVTLFSPVVLYYLDISFVKQTIDSLYRFLFVSGREKALITGGIFQNVEVIWIMFAIPITLIAFFITYYLQYGRLTIAKNRHRVVLQDTWNVQAYFQWLTNPRVWADRKAKDYGTEPYLFGVFMFVTSIIYYINIHTTLSFTLLIIVLKGISVLLCSILISNIIWYKQLRPYFNLFYFVTLLFCVPFVGTLTSLADTNGLFPVINIVLYMVLLATLVDWRTFLLLQTIGGVLALWVHKYMAGTFLPIFEQGQGWLFLFGMVATMVIILVFLRKKQRIQQQRTYQLASDNTTYRQTIQTYMETQRQLTDTLDKRSSMMELIEELTSKLANRKDVDEEIKEHSHRIQKAAEHFQNRANQAKEWLLLKVAPFKLNQLLQQGLTQLKNVGLDLEDELELVTKTAQDELVGDRHYLEKLLVQSVIYLHQKSNQKVYLIVDDVQLDYTLPEAKKGHIVQGIRFTVTNQLNHTHPQSTYHPLEGETSLIDAQSLEMVGNLRITQAHYGMTFSEVHNDYVSQTYVIPTDLKSLRPKIAYFAEEDLSKNIQLDDPADQAFLQAVKSKQLKAFDTIQKALRVAKYYHRKDRRKSGEPFYLHPLAVATILLDYTEDSVMIVGALLHDTIEDTPYTLRQLEAMFGYEIATIVDEVTHLYSRSGRAFKLDKKESLQQLLAKENRKSLMVKLADRLHNMRTIRAKQPHKQRRIAQETLDFFIPVAQMFKLKTIEQELYKRAQDVLKKAN